MVSPLSILKRYLFREMLASAELGAFIERLEKGSSKYLKARMHWYRKFSIPITCLAMGILAVSLGICLRNSNRAYGIALCLFFFFFYYLLLSARMAFGENGIYPPVLAMWKPNILLGGLGIYFMERVAIDKATFFSSLPVISSYIAKRSKKK